MPRINDNISHASTNCDTTSSYVSASFQRTISPIDQCLFRSDNSESHECSCITGSHVRDLIDEALAILEEDDSTLNKFDFEFMNEMGNSQGSSAGETDENKNTLKQ